MANSVDDPSRPPTGQTSQIVLRSPGSLRPNPWNARIHPKKQTRQIEASIDAVGFIGAVIIDENDVVLAGAGRLEAAKHLGLAMVPTITVAGLNEAKKRAFALADNKIAENAGWDREILLQELGELGPLLEPLNLDLTLTGFEPAEIDALFADLQDDRPDPADIVPAVEESIVTRPGDLWRYGQHRLLCGDARSPADLDRLMGKSRASMAFLDPPYNVRVADVQGRGNTKHPEFAYASGEMKPSEYVTFLNEALANVSRVSTDGGLIYACIDWHHLPEMIAAAKEVFGEMINLVVWAKTNAGMGSFYRSQYELICVFWVGRAKHRNNVELGRFGRNRSNLWTYAGANSFGRERMEHLRMHPTVKPVALIADAMRDSTVKGDIVLDCFAGSGSTLMAAEKVGRRGRGMELEPRYVDVAIRRWETHTKSEAILDADGRTFAEVKAERLASQKRITSTFVAKAPDDPANLDSAATDEVSGSDWVALCEEVAVLPPSEGTHE
jgi:DNA modification methylase